MKNKIQHYKKICIIFVLLTLIPLLSYSHSGKTDSSGGHYDRSTGEYHYHHGYPAHQHIDGVCPYDYDDKIDHTTANTTSNTIDINKIPKYNIYVRTTNTSNTINNQPVKEIKKDYFWIIALLVLFWWVPISAIETVIEIIENKYKNQKNKSNVIEISPTKIETIETQTKAIPPIPTKNYYYTCPKCGGQLQVKSGKYGKFIGCKNYPYCHYTRNVYRKR